MTIKHTRRVRRAVDNAGRGNFALTAMPRFGTETYNFHRQAAELACLANGGMDGMMIATDFSAFLGHTKLLVAGVVAGAGFCIVQVAKFVGYPKIESLAKSAGKQVRHRLKKRSRMVGLLIHEPRHGTQCPRKPLIKGVALGGNDIWVIVHPVGSNEFFVQPQPRVQPDGSWSVIGFVGEEGTNDVGHTYELMAVGNPFSPLNRDDQLGKWPRAEINSGIIQVVRC